MKTGFSWNHTNIENSFFDTYFFYQKRDFNSKLPFNFGGIISLERDYYGLGTKYSKFKKYDNRTRTSVIGIDYLNQSDDRKRFKNNFGVKEGLTLDQSENFKTTGLYLLNQIIYNSGLLFRYGIRYDINSIGIDSNNKVNLDKLNPSLGFSYQVNQSNNIFISFGTSFETPTLNELSNNPDGSGFNKDLKSNSSVNYEIGWRKSLSKLSFEAVAYITNSDNEILPYEIELFPGKNFYSNVGSTSRKGIELSSALSFNGGLFTLNYTLSNNRFKDFILDGNDLSDKIIPGIPSQMLDLELLFKLSRKSSLIFTNRFIGERYADNLNETLVSPYSIFNIKYSNKILKNSDFSIGVNNVFNQNFYDNIRINAFGKRYYEPAPKRNFYFGINFSF